MKNKKIIILVVALIIIATIGVGLAVYYQYSLKPLDKNGEEKLVDIPSGYSLKKISSLLKESEIIKNSTSFELYVKQKALGNKLKAGKYLLSPAYSVDEVVEMIVGGKVINESIAVTFPEGWTLKQMAEELEKNNLVSSKDMFIAEASEIEKYQSSYTFLSTIDNISERTLEGYLFPDTYYFDKDERVENIVKKMLSRFDEVFKKEYSKTAQELGMTVDDIVILSSIVEQESKFDIDRPGVAGVFYNRLEKNMKLQSDVTVLYALGVKKEQVLWKDLEVDSKYNTYKYLGLPIGPIGSFGEASLKATLNPQDHNYYYFIAKPDGYCIFNETLKEHDIDVNTYLR